MKAFLDMINQLIQLICQIFKYLNKNITIIKYLTDIIKEQKVSLKNQQQNTVHTLLIRDKNKYSVEKEMQKEDYSLFYA